MTLYDGKLKAYNDEQVGVSTGDPRTFTSFQDLWDAVCRQAENIMQHTFIHQHVADTLKSDHIASPMFSMLHDLCMKDCKGIHSGPVTDAVYLGFFDIMGFGTLIDSLAAIKKAALVFFGIILATVILAVIKRETLRKTSVDFSRTYNQTQSYTIAYQQSPDVSDGL